MALVSDIINLTFEDLGFIAVGEAITVAIQTDAFNRLNAVLDMLSAEGLSVPTQATTIYPLAAGVSAYTFGVGGTFNTTARAMKAIAWRSFYSTVLESGGRVLSLAEFGEQAKQMYGQVAAVPLIVGADTAFPLINLRVFPPPSNTPGQLELAYWTPIANFVTVGDTVTLPPGWLKYLRAVLAADLFPQYGRQGTAAAIQAAYQQARAAIIAENAMTAPQPTPSAPQGQQ